MTPIEQPVPDAQLRGALGSLGNNEFAGVTRTAGFAVPFLRSVFSELLSLRSRPSMSGVRVRELEWKHYPANNIGSEEWVASGICDFHAIVAKRGDGWQLLCDRNSYSLDEAKAAAQADYEARILSALTPDPAASADEAEGELLALVRKIAALRDHEPPRATVATLVMEARTAIRNAEAGHE